MVIRPGVMPGFTELASDTVLAQNLGSELFGTLLRMCHVAQPSVDVPGSWVVDLKQTDLASFMGVSRNKMIRILNELVTGNMLALDEGARLGRGFGSVNNRYFITAIPGMSAPVPSHTPPQPMTRIAPKDVHQGADLKIRESRFSTLQDRTLKDATPLSGTPQGSAPSQSSSYSVTKLQDVYTLTNKELLDESETEQRQRETAPCDSDADQPSARMRSALESIGWIGPLPLTHDHHLVTQVALWLSRQDLANKAGYLNKVIRNGDLTTFAASKGIKVPITRAGLTSAEFTRLKNLYPDWSELVDEAAQALAIERGVTVRMALRCEVAATIPTPEHNQAGKILGGGM